MPIGVAVKDVVFLGSKDIGFECLKILNLKSKEYEYNIAGVLTNKRGKAIVSFARKNNLNLLNSLEEYLNLRNVDIVISIQYHEILKLDHIRKANDLAVNLHMAPLPEYRGCNQFSFAIVDEAEQFGTTIHMMDEKIDHGDILFEDRFEIPGGCWAEDLFRITYKKSIELFKSSLEKIILNEVTPRPQALYRDRKRSLHYRGDILELKNIDLRWDNDKIEKHIRATSMPGFEPPYTIINKKKFSFVRI